MTRKRSSYRPREVDHNPLARLTPASPEAIRNLIAQFDSALLTMTQGKSPNEGEWRLLADCINTIETLAFGSSPKLVIDEVQPVIDAAVWAMTRAAARYKEGLGMRLDAQGIEAIRECIDIYRQCAEGLTAREMVDAQAETQYRVSLALARQNSTAL